MNQIHIDVQRVIDEGPEEPDIRRCIESVLKEEKITDDIELTVRIVDEAEITSLNLEYRNKTGSTNILSFPFELPAEIDLSEMMNSRLLGDLVIAASVVKREAQVQGKTQAAHWAHLLVHGTLHLLGYDHQHAKEAENMEHKEITILNTLGYTNPYRVEQNA
jgi:probable rRNA maturation factor